MVSGQLETVGRNWTLRASLQRGIIKAIVRFHKSPLHREDTSLNSKLNLLLPSGHEPTPTYMILKVVMAIVSQKKIHVSFSYFI